MSGPVPAARPKPAPAHAEISPEHYLRIILHRKWLVLAALTAVSLGTFIVSSRLPNLYTSETVILVDPQKVPDSYVKATVTGDIRDRLGTLSQQVLSATRLQKIIDSFNLYPEERKTLAREDVILLMRKSISVSIISEFGGGQDLQAFRIAYTGKEPRLVAQVTNELASLFIDENLKAREQEAMGTTEFLENQLRDTRKTLEDQEQKLKEFKLKHIGEMPEQQSADLQIMGQLKSELQLESEALSRAEQQKSYVQSMMAQTAPVIDMDSTENVPKGGGPAAQKNESSLNTARAKLALLQSHYTDKYPDIVKLKRQIAEEEAREKAAAAQNAPSKTQEASDAPAAPPVRKRPPPAPNVVNPVLESQLETLDTEISKHKQQQQQLSEQVAAYQAKLEAIPVREQEIADLERDYEISKGHYSQLLEKQLSAETATQLEIRQKGERFSILDPAQPAGKPSSPNRVLINAGGILGGLLLGLLLTLLKEFLGSSITAPEQMAAASGLPVLETIPLIRTKSDRRKQLILAVATGAAVILGCCAVILYHFRDRFI